MRSRTKLGLVTIAAAFTIGADTPEQLVDTLERHLWARERADYRWADIPADKLPALGEVHRRFVETGANIACFDVKVTGDVTATVDGQLQAGLMIVDYFLNAEYRHNVSEDGWHSVPSVNVTRDRCGRSWTFFVAADGTIVRAFTPK